MEVHHHSHPPQGEHHAKKIGHYFWEFLMLFLAVTCGFFAEYQLEHKVEKNRERQYIKSLLEDLKADSMMLGLRAYGVTTTRMSRADSLWRWMNAPDRAAHANRIFFENAEAFRHGKYKLHDRTIVQLKNAGGMRLITDEQVVDTIYAYYKEVGSIEGFDDAIHVYIEKLIDITAELFSAGDWALANTTSNFDSLNKHQLHFRSEDPVLINKYCIYMFMYRSRESGLRNTAIQLKERCLKMIEFIKKEYHLD